jgi:hypothetical protein
MNQYDLEVAYDDLIEKYNEMKSILKRFYESIDSCGNVLCEFWDMQDLLDSAHHILEMSGGHVDFRDRDEIDDPRGDVELFYKYGSKMRPDDEG